LEKDKNRRSPGARAFLARDFARAIGFAKSSTAWHFLPNCLNCKLQMQNCWISLLEFFLANYSNANLKYKTLGDAEHPQPFCIIGLSNEGVCQVSKKYGKGEKRQSPMV